MFDVSDTIVAISSPPGAAARGIVRLDGPRALDLAAECFRPTDGVLLHEQASWRRIAGAVRVADTDLPGHALIFRSPRSYTRQDMIELHLTGAPGVLAMLLEGLLGAGARRASGGEFTARAYLNGAIGLAAAEGVAALVAAGSDLELRAARRLLDGELSRLALEAREELADLLALVEGSLDFADEPIEFIDAPTLQARLNALDERLSRTRAAGRAAERFGELPRVVLTGRPNAGKSSLLNRLTGEDRALCSPIAGTTRDWIAAPMRVGDGNVLLLDSAGLHVPRGEIERLAQASAQRAADTADLVLLVADATTQPEEASWPATPALVVVNKVDLLPDGAARRRAIETWSAPGVPGVAVSARTGEGCDRLRAVLRELLAGRSGDERSTRLALSLEQREALDGAIQAVRRARELAAIEGPTAAPELIALELHEAAGRLALLAGELVPDELLGRIFARFCIGK